MVQYSCASHSVSNQVAFLAQATKTIGSRALPSEDNLAFISSGY